MEQLLAHLIGDYILQTDEMAAEKTKRLTAAIHHALVYALPFWFLDPSLPAMIVIMGTHALIDRYRVARYLVWAKNQLAVPKYRYPLSEAAWHGYKSDKPEWLAGWLLIIADNTLHLLINYMALRWL